MTLETLFRLTMDRGGLIQYIYAKEKTTKIIIIVLLASVGIAVATTLVPGKSRLFSDAELRKMADDSTYKVPDGFYKEPDTTNSVNYYENGPNNFYCAKDTDSANETINRYVEGFNTPVNDSLKMELVNPTANETDKYYEYTVSRIYNWGVDGGSRAYARESYQRILKCGYISDLKYWSYDKAAYDKDSAELSAQGDYTGSFAKRAVTKKNVFELVGFLRNMKEGDMQGSKVVDSSVKVGLNAITVNLLEMSVSRGDYGMDDSIYLHESVYTVGRKDGKITYVEKKQTDHHDKRDGNRDQRHQICRLRDIDSVRSYVSDADDYDRYHHKQTSQGSALI